MWSGRTCATIVSVPEIPPPTDSATDPADGPLDPFGPGAPSRLGPLPAKGTGTSGRTVLIVFGIGLLVAILSLAGTAFSQRQSSGVTATTERYSATDTEATITFVVTKKAADTVRCSVVAQDFYYSVIGTTSDLVIAPGNTRDEVTATVSTPKRANAVVVHDCVVVAPQG